MVATCTPELVAVQDEGVSLPVGARAQADDVAAGARLGHAQRTDVLACSRRVAHISTFSLLVHEWGNNASAQDGCVTCLTVRKQQTRGGTAVRQATDEMLALARNARLRRVRACQQLGQELVLLLLRRVAHELADAQIAVCAVRQRH